MPATFNIVPCQEKRPLVPWQEWTEKRIPPEVSAEWDKQYPNSAKGIITGPISQIFVLDVDEAGALDGYMLPRTATVKTPHGKHYYFRWMKELDDKVTTKVGVLPKVDVRGAGGFVRFYGWELPPYIAPMSNPPRWLIDLLPSRNGGKSIAAGPAKVLQGISEEAHNRNASFASLAGSLRARGYDAEAIFEFLQPKAKEVNFSDDELRLVCQSVGRYPTSAVVPSLDGQGQSVEAFLADQTAVTWICKPFIAEQSIGIIGGLPESRKSWIVVDLAVECARGGGLWLNKFPVKGCKVLLIDQERSKAEVQRRLKAVIAAKGLNAANIRDTLFVRSGTSTRIDLQTSFDALRKELTDLKPSLILVDSFATFHTKEESNRMEIQQVMERIKQLRNEFNCAIVLIHHATKQSYQAHKEGAEPSYLDLAGNVAIPAAAEMCLSIVKHDEETSFVHHTKSTQGTKCAPFLVRVRDLEPGQISVEAF